MARRLANYVLLCLAATFLAFALASLTFSPLGQLQGRNPPPPASVIEAKRAELLKFGGLQLNEAAGTTVLYFTGEFSPSFQGS